MYEFDNVVDANKWLQQGNLLAYPTESVWGIGCDAMNEQAVNKILTIKNRPIEKGMIVITESIDRIEPLLANLTQQQRDSILLSWHSTDGAKQQQATTWLLPLAEDSNIPNWITGQHSSVAVRVISHPRIQQLCASMVSQLNPFGFVISTSCNPATHSPASSFAEAYRYFHAQNTVSYLRDETLGYKMPSQIKDAITGKVLR